MASDFGVSCIKPNSVREFIKKMASCEKCYKYHNQVVSKECNFCRDYSFKENILYAMFDF
jgi:recombinational DNA repair protein RecR